MTDIYAPDFNNDDFGTNFKRPKGSLSIERKAKKAELKAHERREMEACKARERRERGGCAWPGCPYKRLTLHACHLYGDAGSHRQMGGDPTGERTLRHRLIGLCAYDHGRLDRREIDVQPQSAAGTDSCCDFLIRVGTNPNGEPIFELFAAERLVGVPVTRSA